MKKNTEIPIGGIGIINGYRVMAKEYLYTDSCDECCFSLNSGYRSPSCPFNKCAAHKREDRKHVLFTIVEKEL